MRNARSQYPATGASSRFDASRTDPIVKGTPIIASIIRPESFAEAASIYCCTYLVLHLGISRVDWRGLNLYWFSIILRIIIIFFPLLV